MTAALAALAVSLSLGVQTERKVEGLLVATSDKKVIRSIFQSFKPGVAYSEFEKSLKSDRFAMFEWGKRSAILIDYDDPFLKSRKAEVKALEILSSKLNPDLTLNLDGLSAKEKAVLSDCVSKYIPVTPKTFDSGSVGLTTSTAFVIQGAGGVRKGARVYSNTAADRARNASLAGRPLRLDLTKMTKEEADRAAEQTTENYLATEAFRTQCFGIASQNLPEGLSEVGKILEKELKQIALDRDAVSRKILVDRKLNGQTLPPSSPYSGLPEAVRSELEKKFLEQRRMNGFSSVEEAQSFLTGASQVDISTSLSIAFSTGKSGQGAIYYSFPIGGASGAP